MYTERVSVHSELEKPHTMAQNKHATSEGHSLPSKTDTDGQKISNQRRSTEDQERDKAVYSYLLRSLTDLGLDEAKSNPKPNESSIASQWGQKDNRIFVRRVLRSALPEYYPDENSSDQPVPGLSLGKLVEILAGIQEYWIKKDSDVHKVQVPRILTRADKLKAFCKFSQLSLEERARLRLPVRSGNMLMQQLLESVTDPIKGLSNDDIIRFYRVALDLYQSFRSAEYKKGDSLERNSLRGLISADVKNLVDEHFHGRLVQEPKAGIIEELVSKVEREISRVAFQCGLSQVESLLRDELDPDNPQIAANHLSRSFVEHLTHSVVENEILTDEFPVYLKHFTVEKIKPLPLYVKTNERKFGLLNAFLLGQDKDTEDINGLERQFAYKVTLHFYIKLPESYEPRFPDLFPVSENSSSEKRFDFFEEITGIGSLISHITAAINSVLLWDIPVLREQRYLPIAHETLRINEVIGQSGYSPVWSHMLVKLCREDDIDLAIRENKNHDEVTRDYELAYGEFCGFDLIEVTAQASLNARLRAIKQEGIDAKTYLTQLCQRVEEVQALRQAQKLLDLYPFSLKAMEAYLDQTIFSGDKYRTRSEQFHFSEALPVRPWSLVAYEAHLEIAKAYFMEGLYRIGKKYLDVLKPHVEQKFLNNLLLAKYELCQFRFYYMADLNDSEYYSNLDRYTAVQKASSALDNAESYLKERLRRFYKLHEFSQSNFHPFFHILSEINKNRAKLHIFASLYHRSGDRWDTLLQPIRLLEKARIYAAQDGDSTGYSYWSCYQSWCYLMLAYLGDNVSQVDPPISLNECIGWAKKLVDHALVCYSSFGQKCYQGIKDNGGKITPVVRQENANKKFYETYGNLQIQVVPLIEELKDSKRNDDLRQEYDPYRRVLRIDMSILKQFRQTQVEPKHQIYLFGTHSTILHFATGMLELCEEQQDQTLLCERIQKALRMFTYCWATAQSCDVTQSDSDAHFIDRNFGGINGDHYGDSLVQGLYPHRITQFADLGKVFVAVCKTIVLLDQPKQTSQNWQDIHTLLDALHVGPHCSLAKSLYQERYNGHLSNQFENIRKYFAQLQRMPPNNGTMIDNRNQIVRAMFRIILGESE